MSQERFPIKQMYDELGNSFYPLTHIDLIKGDKNKLAELGTTINKIDLTEFISAGYSGTFYLYLLNNFIYFYTGSIVWAENVPFPVDKEIILAKDLPTAYRSSEQIIHCKASISKNERINIWINERGELIAKITPRVIYKDDSYNEYKSSIYTIDFDGLLVKQTMEG